MRGVPTWRKPDQILLAAIGILVLLQLLCAMTPLIFYDSRSLPTCGACPIHKERRVQPYPLERLCQQSFGSSDCSWNFVGD